MKQIEYSDKQKLVIEIVNDFMSIFDTESLYEHQRKELFVKKQEIYNKYGIKEKYLTLREYLTKHSSGAYHYFHFKIYNDIKIDTTGVSDFASIYNADWLDRYFVLSDTKKDNGGDCTNYQCDHYLELVLKE